MSCFWDAVFSSLKDNDYKFLYLKMYDVQKNLDKINLNNLKIILKEIKKTNISDLILLLIKYNKKCENVIWNNQILSKQLLEESFNHVKDFIKNNTKSDIKNDNKNIMPIVNNGYLCSICDPFLILICELFEFEIKHKYLNNMMIYKNKNGKRRTIGFSSDQGHFMIL